MGTIYPLLNYADPAKAVDWLEGAFGFARKAMSEGPDGGVVHAEIAYGDDVIMLSRGEPAGGAGLYVAVEDPDAHHDRAKAAGAEITMGLTDQPYGSREYGCRDLGGHVWYFGTYRP